MYYEHTRPEVRGLIPRHTLRLLDVGCGAGKFAAEAKRSGLTKEAYGIELVPEVAERAKDVLDGAIAGDVEQDAIPWAGFDCIVCADVLEHLRDPWATLRKLRAHLTPSGVIVASIPNIAHWTVVLKIVLDRFAYQDEGILDRTHLRFFTQSTIRSMFSECGFRIARLDSVKLQTKREKMFRALTLGCAHKLSTYQYLVLAKSA